MRTGAVVAAAGALVASLVATGPGSASAAEDERRGERSFPVGDSSTSLWAAEASDVPASERNGNLTGRPSGLPAAGAAAARQLTSAKVRQDLDAGKISATVVLKAAPAADTDSFMLVGFGTVNSNNACDVESGIAHEETTRTYSTSNGFTRNGRTISVSKKVSGAGYLNWECAVVALYPPEVGDAPYDALVGGLVSTPAKPKLRITKVNLLGKDQKKIKVVRNTWTPLEVSVRNNGKVDATGVRITSGNKAFKVRKPKVGKVWKNGGVTTSRIEVRRVKKAKNAKLRLVARGNGVKGATTRKTVRIAKPRKPVAGKYRAKNGQIAFRVNKSGKIVNFRARKVQMVCRPPLEYATYYRTNLTYPRKPKVRANGILDVTMRWEKGNAWYNAGLQMRVAGKKITQGRFSYSTANYCRVTETFTPNRR